jgi:hypothetical protein
VECASVRLEFLFFMRHQVGASRKKLIYFTQQDLDALAGDALLVHAQVLKTLYQGDPMCPMPSLFNVEYVYHRQFSKHPISPP